MKCIIHAKSKGSEWIETFFPGVHPYLLKFANKPLIEFYIEHCYKKGIEEIKIVSDIPSLELKNFCGNGDKWGVKISYSLSKEDDSRETVLKKNSSFLENGPVLFFEGQQFISISSGADTDYEFKKLDNIKDFYSCNMSVLRNSKGKTVLPGYTKEAGVFIGQNVEIARSCDLKKPFSIGDNVRLEQLTVIGENSIVGSNVIISSATTVADSIVYDGTFVGVDLDIKGKIVFKDKIINPDKGTIIPIVDEFVISPVKKEEKRLARFFSDFIIACILILLMTPFFLPFFLIGVTFKNIKFKKEVYFVDRKLNTRNILRLITDGRSLVHRIFRRFSLTKYPLFFYVLAGKISISGNKLFKENLENRRVVGGFERYLPGVFNYSEVYGTDDQFETLIMNEHYYNRHRSYAGDIKLIFKALISTLVS